jgi:hypothetical protein
VYCCIAASLSCYNITKLGIHARHARLDTLYTSSCKATRASQHCLLPHPQAPPPQPGTTRHHHATQLPPQAQGVAHTPSACSPHTVQPRPARAPSYCDGLTRHGTATTTISSRCPRCTPLPRYTSHIHCDCHLYSSAGSHAAAPPCQPAALPYPSACPLQLFLCGVMGSSMLASMCLMNVMASCTVGLTAMSSHTHVGRPSSTHTQRCPGCSSTAARQNVSRLVQGGQVLRLPLQQGGA